MARKQWLVPYMLDGSIPEYADTNCRYPLTWKEPEVFSAGIKIVGYLRGRSAANFIVKNIDTKAKYTVFLTDMMDIFDSCIIDKGCIRFNDFVHIDWIPVKRGSYYGIKMVKK